MPGNSSDPKKIKKPAIKISYLVFPGINSLMDCKNCETVHLSASFCNGAVIEGFDAVLCCREEAYRVA